MGIEPGTSRMQVHCVNHCATDTICLEVHSNAQCRVEQIRKSLAKDLQILTIHTWLVLR